MNNYNDLEFAEEDKIFRLATPMKKLELKLIHIGKPALTFFPGWREL